MKNAHRVAGIVAALGLGLAVASAYAHPGQGQGRMEHGKGGERHAMQEQGHGHGHAHGAGRHGGQRHGEARGEHGGRGAGAQLMTPEERTALREKMRNATPEERQQIAAATRAEMQKRAQEKGVTLPEGRGPRHGATTEHRR
jgi:hypothetical protein